MHDYFINEAFKEAKKAYNIGEIPVGAVIVKDGKIISKAHNIIEKKEDATMHAEIIAIKKASKILNNWRLNDCEMYVTLKPCTMCQGAIYQSRIKKVYYLIDSNFNVKSPDYVKINDSLLALNTEQLMKKIFNRNN